MAAAGSIPNTTGRTERLLTQAVAHSSQPADQATAEPGPAARPAIRPLPPLLWTLLTLTAGLLLVQRRDPVTSTTLAVGALAVPMLGYERVFRRWFPGFGARSAALAGGVTLALWCLLEFLLVLIGHTTAPEAQAVLLAVILLPVFALAPPSGRGALDALQVIGSLRVGLRSAGLILVVAVPALAGALVIEHAQHIASGELSPTNAFGVFWLGMALVYLPLAFAVLFAWRVPVALRGIAVGAVSYLPTFVRSPLKVFNFDEYGHLGEARQIIFFGKLFQPDSTVPIGAKYPGFETLVVGIARLTGLPIVAAGQLCILACHIVVVLSLLGIAAIVHQGSVRAAMLAGLLYAVSPQFVQFDALFSYETFALPLFMLMLLTCMAGLTARHSSRQRRRYTGLGVFFLLALLITHHLTTIVLGGALVLAAVTFGITALHRRRVDRPSARAAGWVGRRLALAGIGVVLLVFGYAVAVGADLPAYLGAFPRSAYLGVRSFLGLSRSVNVSTATTYDQRQGATRALFQGTALPTYERLVGIAVQVVLVAICLWVCWRLRRRLTPWLGLAILLAGCYFASLPLSFISVASSGAHRTWAFTFIGVALVASRIAVLSDPALVVDRPSRARALAGTVGMVLLVGAVLMSSYATSVNLYSRFPGPYVMGADGRDDTSDVQRSATWLLDAAGPGAKILSTRRTAMVFTAVSTAQLVAYPGWQIFYPPTQPNASWIELLRSTGAQYLVVDDRLDSAIPTQSYFKPTELPAPSTPLPVASVEKFKQSSWLQEVHADGHIVIYRLIDS